MASARRKCSSARIRGHPPHRMQDASGRAHASRLGRSSAHNLIELGHVWANLSDAHKGGLVNVGVENTERLGSTSSYTHLLSDLRASGRSNIPESAPAARARKRCSEPVLGSAVPGGQHERLKNCRVPGRQGRAAAWCRRAVISQTCNDYVDKTCKLETKKCRHRVTIRDYRRFCNNAPLVISAGTHTATKLQCQSMQTPKRRELREDPVRCKISEGSELLVKVQAISRPSVLSVICRGAAFSCSWTVKGAAPLPLQSTRHCRRRQKGLDLDLQAMNWRWIPRRARRCLARKSRSRPGGASRVPPTALSNVISPSSSPPRQQGPQLLERDCSGHAAPRSATCQDLLNPHGFHHQSTGRKATVSDSHVADANVLAEGQKQAESASQIRARKRPACNRPIQARVCGSRTPASRVHTTSYTSARC